MVMHHEIGRDPLYKIWNTSGNNMIIYFYTDGGYIVFHDEMYPIERGSLCFIKAGKIHYTIPHDPRVYDRSKIFLSEKSTLSLLLSVPGNSDFYELFSKNSVVYAKLPDDKLAITEELYANASSYLESGHEERLSLSFFSLMCLISEFSIHNIKESDEFMGKAIEYIHSNLSSQISLDELCAIVNMSKSHFCRKFKQIMGMTVMEYILATRIAEAKTLLLSEDLSISQISDRCGFSSVSFFCQVFKAKEGITPKKFRQNSNSASK